MRRDHAEATQTPDCGKLLSAREAAQTVRLSMPAFWRAVRSKRLPLPVYPAPRAPRWFEGELLAALERTRASPSEAKALRIRSRSALRP